MKYLTAWCPLEHDTVSVIIQMRLELASYMETMLEVPPVYFRDRYMLEAWALLAGFILEERTPNTLYVKGWKGNGTELAHFRQIWVRAGYSDYRDRFLEFHRGLCERYPDGVKKIDADHVINRSRIPDNSWVQLFPVPIAANQAYGSKFERYFPKVHGNTKRIDLPPLVCFKLYCGKIPSNDSELRWAMSDVRNQFLDTIPEIRSYCDQMERSVQCHMNGNFSGARRNNVSPLPRRTALERKRYNFFRDQFPDIAPPLFLATQSADTQSVAILLYMNEDPNVRRANGDTPLHIAAQCGHTEVVRHLIAARADPNAGCGRGTTALHLASHRGLVSTAKALIAGGADVNQTRNGGDTALHLAVQGGHHRLAATLLTAGADPDIKRRDGVVALHIAAHQGDSQLSRCLLRHGADANAALADGRRARDLGGRRWLAELAGKPPVSPP